MMSQSQNASQSQSVDSKSKLHTIPDFYSVYLIQSIPKPRSFYIGSTPDPLRRLKQHNGELKAGGAYRTKRPGCRPWKLVVLVYGFPSKISALQFEHSLQHPHQTRHIDSQNRVTTSRSSGSSIHQKLANIKLLLQSTGFNKMNLSVNIFDEKVGEVWLLNKFKITDNVNPSFMTFDEFFTDETLQLSKVSLDLIHQQDFQMAKSFILNNTPICNLCNQPINYFLEDTSNGSQILLTGFCYHSPDCSAFHLTCIAKTTPSLIPDSVQCPNCNNQLTWSRIIKTSTKIRQYISKDTLSKQSE
ncbi:SLX1 [[Candida] subhashii]|uniref:SLX1 n=1 Tax=[Candida] subhashii TaxID=561895 RepID=A0A8J5UZR2_9ASCO|nr:SLX1 [[Candida] subhashii]KAG7664985.1 SLX1 [[Candida] subhashii]